MPAILSYRQLINGVVAFISTGWQDMAWQHEVRLPQNRLIKTHPGRCTVRSCAALSFAILFEMTTKLPY